MIENERTYRISERAARITLAVFVPLVAITAAVLIGLSKSVTPEVRTAGYALAYTVCALMVFYSGFYYYYEKKS